MEYGVSTLNKEVIYSESEEKKQEQMAFKGWNQNWNKYGAKKCSYKGIEFASNVERDRYIFLSYMQMDGKISNLHTQWRFEIIEKITKVVPVQLKTKVRNDTKVIESAAHYTCDTIYKEGDKYVVEDVKSEYGRKGSRDFPLRRHLMIKKMKEHNKKGRGQWIFREAVLVGKSLKIKDYEP